MIGKHKARKGWMQRHVHDPYVQQAQKDGYRSRAAYKLLEIDRKEKLLKPGAVIVDLGSAPGGWSQVAAQKLAGRGKVLAVDLLPMAPLEGVIFIRGDFREQAIVAEMAEHVRPGQVDLVLSDMAPNMSGIVARDQALALDLALSAMRFALDVLKPNGVFLVKGFHGEDFEALRHAMKEAFVAAATVKPKASRQESTEVYLLGRGVHGT